MGKIADALERHKEEKAVTTSPFTVGGSEGTVKDPRPSSAATISNLFSPKLVAYSDPDSVEAENFKILRSKILFPRNGNRPRTIMITSPFPGEGKTFVAANLAVSIALGINEHVLLVDCDFRHPSLHKMLGYSNSEGLYDYLTRKKDLSELLIKTRLEKLTLLSAGRPSQGASEWLSSPMMEKFVEEVKQRYQDRYVLLDTTPIRVTAEAGVLAGFVDGVILVVMANRSARTQIKKCIDGLGKQRIFGIIFNGYEDAFGSYNKLYRRYSQRVG